ERPDDARFRGSAIPRNATQADRRRTPRRTPQRYWCARPARLPSNVWREAKSRRSAPANPHRPDSPLRDGPSAQPHASRYGGAIAARGDFPDAWGRRQDARPQFHRQCPWFSVRIGLCASASAFHDVANLAQQGHVFRNDSWRGFLRRGELVDLTDQQEQHERHDEEIDHRVDEVAIV